MTDSIPELVKTITSGNEKHLRAAARLMSLMQDQPELFGEIVGISEASGGEGQSQLILGLTGAPGVGKSTLSDALVGEFRKRRPEKMVGVIAVDPSSPITGGAIMGDRIRMMRHASDPKVFIRSMATRGESGGLAPGIAGVLGVMELLGCSLIIIETVGVGQNEYEIASLVDLVGIVLCPGMGDSVQMLKAGLMEVGDLFIVNKADRPGAQAYRTSLLSEVSDPEMVHLTCAPKGQGIGELLDHLESLADANQEQWLIARRERLAKPGFSADTGVAPPSP